MTTRLKLKPGQKGTKKLFAEHGDALVCVRYRYDEVNSAKDAKGRWNPEARLCFIRFGKIKGTALEKHIVLDAFSVPSITSWNVPATR